MIHLLSYITRKGKKNRMQRCNGEIISQPMTWWTLSELVFVSICGAQGSEQRCFCTAPVNQTPKCVWLCFQALKNLARDGDFDQSQFISERAFVLRVPIGCAPAGGRCLVFPQQISTWLPGHKLSHFTAKQYTTICFWKHLRREIGITVTEYWFIFDQHCLVLPFGWSLRVIDSCLETAGASSALIGCFSPVCEIL